MDTLFRLVSLHHHHQQQQQQPQAAAPYPSPDQLHHHQQQSPYYSSSSRSSTGSPSASTPHNNNYYYYSNSNYSYYPCSSAGGTGGGYYFQEQQTATTHLHEECGNEHRFYMDEDFSSSSSSRQFHQSSGGAAQQQQQQQSPPVPATTSTPPASTSSTQHGLFEAADFSFPSVDIDLDFSSGGSPAGGTGASASPSGTGRWASQLLLECARAVAAHDSQRVQQLMWMLNELASPYGDVDQKLSSYFLQGLFARLTSSGPRTLRTLSAAADRNTSFESTRRVALRFQELSPWASFGHVAANGAILESFLLLPDQNAGGGASASASSETTAPPARLHILDLSDTFCTQWPTLLEALATRSADDTPHLSVTTVVPAAQQRVMREVAQRLEKFARLMGVPFAFRVVHHAGDLADLDLDALGLFRDATTNAALAVNCVNALRGVGAPRRDAFLASIRRLEPRVVTVVEEEADLVPDASASASSGQDTTDDAAAFVKVLGEGLRFFTAYMDSLEESFPKTSNERLALERAAGRAIVDLVSCPASESAERRETGASWARRMRSAGFSPVAFSDDIADDMRSLLRRYREGWSLREPGADVDGAAAGAFLAWKDQPVVWTSAWRP